MTPTISATSVSQRYSLVTIRGPMRRHIHSLSDETVRQALACLDARGLRHAAQVCARWRRLATSLSRPESRFHPPVPDLSWNVLKHVFALLDLLGLQSAARVCAQWRIVALSFFSENLGRRHIHDLPAEIIKQSFALLEFDELRYAAQVCVRWRDLGIEHPGFWKDVKLRSATTGSMDMLAARLGQSNGRPCTLDIDIDYLHRNVEGRLMEILMAILPTVQVLSIRIDSIYLITLWTVVRHPAPELVDFHLKLYSPDRIMPRDTLDPWIFNNAPGKLRKVHIEDVLLPFYTCDTIPAFSQLRVLILIHDAGTYGEFPSCLLDWCPQLESLTYFTGTCSFGKKFSTDALATLSRLDQLEIHLAPEGRADFLARMPLINRIPVVTFTTPDFDSVYDLIEPLYSPFNFGFISFNSQVFYVHLEEDRSGYRRAFAEYLATYDRSPEGNNDAHPLFEHPELCQKLNFLKISHSLWDLLLPYLGFYANVTKLVLDLDSDSSTIFPTLPRNRRMAFPCLETLVLEARRGLDFVSAQDVIDFVDQTIQAPRCRALDLRLVWFNGSYEIAWTRFDSISYSTARHSRAITRKP